MCRRALWRVLVLEDTPMKLKPISEQVVVIMGASSGIGRQAALDFAAKGAKVRSREYDLPATWVCQGWIVDGGVQIMLGC